MTSSTTNLIHLKTKTRKTMTTNHPDTLCACCRLGDLATTLRRELADNPLVIDAAVAAHAHREVIAAIDTLHHNARSRT